MSPPKRQKVEGGADADVDPTPPPSDAEAEGQAVALRRFVEQWLPRPSDGPNATAASILGDEVRGHHPGDGWIPVAPHRRFAAPALRSTRACANRVRDC